MMDASKGSQGSFTRVDIMKMVKQNPTGSAMLAKLTQSQLYGNEQVGQGMDTHAASLMAI